MEEESVQQKSNYGQKLHDYGPVALILGMTIIIVLVYIGYGLKNKNHKCDKEKFCPVCMSKEKFTPMQQKGFPTTGSTISGAVKWDLKDRAKDPKGLSIRDYQLEQGLMSGQFV